LVLQTLAGTVQSDTDGDRQTSPGDDGPMGPPAPPQAPGSPATQFDPATLGGLLTAQQQSQGTNAPPSGAGYPHHHGHHGHGHHGGATGVGQGQTGPDSSAGDGLAAATQSA